MEPLAWWLIMLTHCGPMTQYDFECHRISLSLVRLIACHLFVLKPLPKLMMTYCQINFHEQSSIKFETKYKIGDLKMNGMNVVRCSIYNTSRYLIKLNISCKFCYWELNPRWHDDVIKWKHFPRNWPFVRGIHRSPVNSPHKGQWRGALMFSLICAR